jgi:hypothetical protein
MLHVQQTYMHVDNVHAPRQRIIRNEEEGAVCPMPW